LATVVGSGGQENSMTMSEAQILVAELDNVVQIRVLGRATFKISQELRDYGLRVLRHGVSNVVIELSGCSGMDSTFMGVLAMIGLEGRQQARLVIVNASKTIRHLLESIGIGRLCEFAAQPVKDVSWQSLCQAASGSIDPANELSQTVLEAHQALMNMDPANIPRFRDVVAILANEIEEKKKKS